MKFIDLFCGIGGFRLGLERANDSIETGIQQRIRQRGKSSSTTKQSFMGTEQFTCVWSCDIDKYARRIYKKNFGEEPEGDITKIPAESIPDHDLLCVGFPCQSFSIAGKRKGFQDTRGTLFFDICRILRVKRPSYCLLENVKGLLSHDKGETFKTILESLDELGYDCQWQVLNSKCFGVPQNRERVFIIGHLRGKRRPEVFPIGESNGISEPTDGGKQENGERVSSTIDSRYGALRNAGETYLIQTAQVGEKDNMGQRIYDPKGIACSIRSQGGGQGAKTGLYELSPCIRSEHHNTADVHFVGNFPKIRRLTPVECERLQGFPDNWTAGISDTQRYKCLGNAVTVNVINFLGRKIRNWREKC